VSAPDPTPELSIGSPAEPTSGDRVHELSAPFDQAVDQLFDRVRGHKAADRIFYEASELADFSLLWHLLGTVKALGAPDPLRAAARSAALLGAESVFLNWGVKSLFRRTRPVHEQVHPHRLRTPLTSSFPSGHASAAFLAASLLSEGGRLGPAYYGLAAVVASSRVYVRAHHASDVVVGAAIGIALGRLARRVWPADGQRGAPARTLGRA
jgi:undecaprenyl-diphosphatase